MFNVLRYQTGTGNILDMMEAGIPWKEKEKGCVEISSVCLSL
jgi:hypothetical protein